MMRRHPMRLLADDRGQVIVEYGMILALLALLLIGVVAALRGGWGSVVHKALACMNKAVQEQGC
ncbi:MAG: Flp family type IVb pilin [Bacillota bacterium]|nr:MAG: Flp family type IVb pilin [Bacillota bacterium]